GGRPRRRGRAVIHALLVAAVSFAVVAAAFAPLERVFPARPGQPLLRPELHVDACFFLGQYFLFAAVSGAAMDAAERVIAPAPLDGVRAFVGALPPLAQVVLTVAAGDLVA